ncbi:GTP-binding protein EngB [Aquipluma nitroreducens]|uniref:Probable GTP-binding protein EngB n=1 Tax=Aquipluma nitroreducens TaxID=2010828 RepID=A0A5K7S5E7_9BACT|nr:ribosome biogenesis GTP-binding protein YihA/YsxC [Aquipluma nitroreducens]BBE16781.1 GTP-binding protein EngB [Aquipluma nitroreducens]
MIKQARFLISNTDVKKCPAPDRPEYAFIGRSNVGKSSLINMLVGQNGLAKVSVRPGKTQLINHFIIDESWYLVDLPGYGYAKISISVKEKFQKLISNYILNRENLYCLFVLIDVRHAPQQIDVEFITWLGENQVPFAIIFTKADKLGKVSLAKNVGAYTQELKKLWEELPSILVSSSLDGTGRDEIISFIENVNKS